MPKENFEDFIASQAKEFNLKQGDLDKAAREELTSLVAKRIAERIMAGEVTPPMSEGATPQPPPGHCSY